MTCPTCRARLLRGRYETVTILGTDSRVRGWRVRWVPSQDLLCPSGHGPFAVEEKK